MRRRRRRRKKDATFVVVWFKDMWGGVEELVTYEMFVSGPGAHGPDVPFGPHVLEAGVFQPAFEVRARTGLHAAFVGGGEVDSVEDFRGVFFREGVVRGAPFEVEVDALDPAAWYRVPDGGYQLALNTGGGGGMGQELHAL